MPSVSVSVGCKREVWPLLLLLALLTGCSNRDEREPAPPNEVPPQVAEAPGQQTERTETEHTEGREDPPTESTGDHGDDEDDVESWCWEGRRFRFERSEHEPPSERTEVRIDGLRWSIAESREGHGPTVFERYKETEGQTWVRVRWLPSGESPLPGEVRLLRVGDAPSESYEMSPENSYALLHSEAPTACLLQAYAYQPDDTTYECEELPWSSSATRKPSSFRGSEDAPATCPSSLTGRKTGCRRCTDCQQPGAMKAAGSSRKLRAATKTALSRPCPR